MKDFSTKEIAEICGGTIIKGGDVIVKNVAIDNRKVTEGDLFVALIGENHDAHKFVTSAVENGASAVLVSNDEIGETFDATIIKVENTLVALQKIAHTGTAELLLYCCYW